MERMRNVSKLINRIGLAASGNDDTKEVKTEIVGSGKRFDYEEITVKVNTDNYLVSVRRNNEFLAERVCADLSEVEEAIRFRVAEING